MPVTLEFTGLDPADSPFARFSWTRAAVQWADEAGPLVRAALKHEAPVSRQVPGGRKPGRLRDSIRYERETMTGGVKALFTTSVDYAPYVIHGTRPHPIPLEPKPPGTALRFYPRGSSTPVFRRQVNHPGTKPNPFPKRAVTPMEPLLREWFARAVRASLEGA